MFKLLYFSDRPFTLISLGSLISQMKILLVSISDGQVKINENTNSKFLMDYIESVQLMLVLSSKLSPNPVPYFKE